MEEKLISDNIKTMLEGNAGKISDGYHTFDQLYKFRVLYNAGMFNSDKTLLKVHKSMNHADGEPCFGGGWFVVVAYTKQGKQISNHYEMRFWDLFNCKVVDRADAWDGHTAEDVEERLVIHLTEDEDFYMKSL